MNNPLPWFGRLSLGLLLFAGVLMQSACTQNSGEPPSGVASSGNVLRPGHLGRTIGDLPTIVHFYHDLLGAGFIGDPDAPVSFFATQPLIDFVTSPPESEFRSVNMPIPGTSVAPGDVPEMVVEAIEFRNIDRHQYLPDMQDPGVSNLTLLVRDLDKTVATLKEAGVIFVTEGGEPVDVSPVPGLTGTARAVIVRDPDGYPVELMQLTPTPETNAPAGSNIIGAHIARVVADLDTTMDFYRHVIGSDLQTWESPDFQLDEAENRLRDTPGAEERLGTMLLPGSGVLMELIQYRNIESTPYHPKIQDIGVGHVAFMVKDMDLVLERLDAEGVKTLGREPGAYQLNPKTRAIYTTDPDGFFLEVMERQE